MSFGPAVVVELGRHGVTVKDALGENHFIRADQLAVTGIGDEGLDAIHRDALVLRYHDDLPPRDVARRLGVPLDTARSRLRRGLELLRTRLDAAYGGDRRAWGAALLLALDG